jgi:hypothetical protein
VLIFSATKLSTHFLPITESLNSCLLEPKIAILTVFAFSFPEKGFSSIFVPCFERDARVRDRSGIPSS